MKWPEVPFEKLAKIVTGNTPPKKDMENYGPGVPWVKPPDLDKWKPITATVETLSPKGQKLARLLPKNTVMVCCIGSIGRVGIAGTTLATNQQINSLVFSKVVEPRFGYYYCRSASNIFEAKARKAIVPILKKSSFAKIKMPVPSVSEQRRIVEILDQADELRMKRTGADEKAERTLPALFYKMFGDPSTNPNGWPTAPLSNLGELDRGKSKHRPRNDPRLLGGPYPFIQTGDVTNSQGYIREFSSTYSEFGLAQSRMWPAGTLCITIAANIASTAILAFDACFPDSVVGFTSGPRTNVGYIRTLFGFIKPILERNAPQLAQKNINLKILRQFPVPVPPKNLQDTFFDYHNRFFRLIEPRHKVQEKLESIWQTLLQNAFSGSLTAKWREAHMKELLAEMEEQLKVLNLQKERKFEYTMAK